MNLATLIPRHGPGLALSALVATAATLLAKLVPVVGAPVLALLGGVLFGALVRGKTTATELFAPGFELARHHLLSAAIVLLGLGLPVGAVLSVGRDTAVVLVGTAAVGAVAALLLGRALAIDPDSAVLVAVGTTICGASAIAAATAVLRPERHRVGYALGTIFLFNVLAVLIYPPLGHLFGLSQPAFGLWAGTAINDTSSVLAAGAAYGAVAAQFAVIVKLVRSLLIVPMCLGLQLTRRDTATKTPLWRIFPLFVVLFVLASVIAGTGLVPVALTSQLASVSGWLIAAALAAIGAAMNWHQVRTAGPRPLLYGGLLSVVLAVSSLALQFFTGWR
ncbi:YeiH family protein [Nocardia callitridis]|uniref:YeiH family protein n=1 Tax=Nocardia callitridis TaxID=648753 RepID=A0ABP9JSA7_9NOCA